MAHRACHKVLVAALIVSESLCARGAGGGGSGLNTCEDCVRNGGAWEFGQCDDTGWCVDYQSCAVDIIGCQLNDGSSCNSIHTNNLYPHGESWFEDGYPCTQYNCNNGEVEEEYIVCPDIDDICGDGSYPIYTEGACCRTCPDDSITSVPGTTDSLLPRIAGAGEECNEFDIPPTLCDQTGGYYCTPSSNVGVMTCQQEVDDSKGSTTIPQLAGEGQACGGEVAAICDDSLGLVCVPTDPATMNGAGSCLRPFSTSSSTQGMSTTTAGGGKDDTTISHTQQTHPATTTHEISSSGAATQDSHTIASTTKAPLVSQSDQTHQATTTHEISSTGAATQDSHTIASTTEAPLVSQSEQSHQTNTTIVSSSSGTTQGPSTFESTTQAQPFTSMSEVVTSLSPSQATIRPACSLGDETVCGVNGQTYINACSAQDAGIVVMYTGPCRGYCADTNGSRINDGDFSTDVRDACLIHECNNGVRVTVTITCSIMQCVDEVEPIFLPGQCCPSCPTTTPESAITTCSVCVAAGRSWQAGLCNSGYNCDIAGVACIRGNATCSVSQELSYTTNPTESMCADTFSPVCGVNGITYNNRCKALREGVGIEHEGVCYTTQRVTSMSSSSAQNINCVTEPPSCGPNGYIQTTQCLPNGTRIPVQTSMLCGSAKSTMSGDDNGLNTITIVVIVIVCVMIVVVSFFAISARNQRRQVAAVTENPSYNLNSSTPITVSPNAPYDLRFSYVV